MNATVPAKKTKAKASEREVLGADGKPQDEYIGAKGFSYKSLSDDYTLAIQFDDLPEEVVLGLAAFGGLTLAGNVTNAVRNGENKSGISSEREALEMWIANLREGNWSKPTGELEAGIHLLAEGFVRANAKAGREVNFDDVFAKLKAADKAKRKEVRNDSHVSVAIAEIQLERKAAKAKEAVGEMVEL